MNSNLPSYNFLGGVGKMYESKSAKSRFRGGGEVLGQMYEPKSAKYQFGGEVSNCLQAHRVKI